MRPRKRKPQNRKGPLVRWKSAEDAPEGPWRRFYQVETLVSAVEKGLSSGRDVAGVALRGLLGTADLTSLHIQLAEENPYRLTFKLNASNSRKKHASLLFTAARNDESFSEMLETEWQHLGAAYKAAPKLVPKPLRGGALFLPDRFRREDKHRLVFAYAAQWPGAIEKLGLGKDTAFTLAGARPRALSKAASETIRLSLAELVFRCYQPAKRTGLDMRDLAPADFWVTLTPKGVPRLWLGACRRMHPRLSPEKNAAHFLARLMAIERPSAFLWPHSTVKPFSRS